MKNTQEAEQGDNHYNMSPSDLVNSIPNDLCKSVDQKPVISWQPVLCFAAFHPVHAGTLSGSSEGEEIDGIDLK